MTSKAIPGSSRAGLTLMELLVVLVILALVATVTMVATEGIVAQARFEATQRTLQNVQDAIIGPAGQRGPEGAPLVTGFVADMGRLPQPFDLTSEPLRELWDPSVILPASRFNVQTFAFPDLKDALNNPLRVQMPCGWRGPYLQLPVGASGRLTDGWGNALDALSQTSGLALATPGTPINLVRSRGADNLIDASVPPLDAPYNLDQYIPNQNSVLLPTPMVSLSDRVFGKLQVHVRAFNPVPMSDPPTVGLGDPIGSGTDKVRLVLFTPVNGILAPVLPDGWPAGDIVLQTTPTPITPNSFLTVPIGTRGVQAFQYDAAMKVTRRSPLTTITVAPSGGTTTLTLVLQ